MKKVFENPSELENLAKQKISIPPFLMMENAAHFLSDFIISIIKNKKINQIVILCGKGNNGGDGFALARLLCTAYENPPVTILVPQMPVAEEAKIQFEMCQKLAGTRIPRPRHLLQARARAGSSPARGIPRSRRRCR